MLLKERTTKKFKPIPKDPLKVHIWGGISARGATQIVIFTGKLCATKLLKMFKVSLVPLITKVYPDGHRLMQDNDPKHCSRLARSVFEQTGIN